MNSREALEDYCLLILAWLACADGSFHPAEADAIREGIENILPAIDRFEERLANTAAQVQTMGKERAANHVKEKLELLQQLTPDQRREFLMLIMNTLNADGKVSEGEVEVFRIIRTALL